MNDEWTLGFVGAGVMAEVMLGGLLDDGVLPPIRIIASDRRDARLTELQDRYAIRTTTDNTAVAAAADVLVLAVKPQNLASVMAGLRGQIPEDTLVLSIIAGAGLRLIQDGLRHDKVARCMPNLPCRIRKGMTVWTVPVDTTTTMRHRVRTILGVMGSEVYVDDEGHVDRATAVNGTGPAIVAEFVKAMFEAAVFIGESRGVAHETVLATVIGTAEMIRQSDEMHVAQIIDEVTSPGGTTSLALQVLKKGNFQATLTDSIDAAYQRTVELGAALDVTVDQEA
ncbi:MAG: pyrroline-5-carboxylate reductase [Myxococcota bacterium]|nr:pyrroline-5-carboxylate reductase [Myxococcota bacterium]